MRSRHNTIRAVAIGLGLTLLVVTGTAAMMAAFHTPTPATDIYRRVSMIPAEAPASTVATAHDSVMYERVVLADGRVQWVLIEESAASLSLAKAPGVDATVADNNTSPAHAGAHKPVSYALVVKPSGLSKALPQCNRSAYGAYDLACKALI